MGVFAYPWVLCLFLEVLLLYLLHVGLQITCNCCVCVCVCVNEMRRKSSLTCFQIYMLLLQQNLLERITFSTCALLQHIFCKPGGCDIAFSHGQADPWSNEHASESFTVCSVFLQSSLGPWGWQYCPGALSQDEDLHGPCPSSSLWDRGFSPLYKWSVTFPEEHLDSHLYGVLRPHGWILVPKGDIRWGYNAHCLELYFTCWIMQDWATRMVLACWFVVTQDEVRAPGCWRSTTDLWPWAAHVRLCVGSYPSVIWPWCCLQSMAPERIRSSSGRHL